MSRSDRGWWWPAAIVSLVSLAAVAAGGESREGSDLAVSEIAAAGRAAVVTLRVRAEEEGERGFGTGFLVDPGGTIVTALHVVSGAGKVVVRTADGERYGRLTVRAFDPASDVAVVQIDGEDLPVVEVGDTSELGLGDSVVVIGNPLGLTRTISEGIVSAWREPLPPPEGLALEDLEEQEEFGERRRVRAVPNVRVLQLSAQLSPGSSGAPVFDRSGRVIGMAVAGLGRHGALDLNFAIPAEFIAPLLEVDERLTLESFRRQVDRAREDLAVPHVERARLALELERTAEARREIDAALQLHPHSTDALLLESELLRREGDLAGAEEALLEVTRRHPDSAEAWYRLGELYLELVGGSSLSLAQARKSLEKALQLDDELAPAARGLGVIAYREGRYLSAARMLERAWGSAQDDMEAALWLGEVYLRMDRAGDARAAFESALELATDDPRAHHGLARTCSVQGQEGSSREHWRRFLDLTAGNEEYEEVRERTVLYLRRYPRLMPLEYDHLLESAPPVGPPT